MFTLLLCKDQTAGSDEILARVAADVKKERDNVILMVPELISHDMERRLCQTAGDTASRFAQVLSFTRLVRRVAEDAHCGVGECLDNGGRVVAMATAARQLHSRLKAYAAVETKPEFLTAVIDAVDEFKRCCISAQDLAAAARQTEGVFAQKLEELSLLLEAYDGICAHGKRDPRDQMTWALEQLEDGDFAQKHIFYIDGFPDFTRQHLAILEHLICTSPNVTVCLNCDAPESAGMAFEKAGETARQLINCAKRSGITVHIERLRGREDALKPLRENLFQGKIATPGQLKNCVCVSRANSVYQECQAVAEKIEDLVISGCRYRDIAVACTDLQAYAGTLRLVFHRHGIPLYLAGTEDVLQSGVMETVTSAVEAAVGGLEQRDVLHYLRSAVSPLTLSQCDIVENYAIVWGISGKRWGEEWKAHPDGLSGHWNEASEQLLAQVNEARALAMEPLIALRKGLREAQNLSQQILALDTFLDTISFAQRLDALAAELNAQGQPRSAQILNQLWDILLSALEQMYDVLGKTVWEEESFLRLLRLLLSQYDVGTIPPVLDSVTAGIVSAMRCQREKHLFVLGGNEGSFPGYSGSSGLLNDQERVQLRSMGIPLTGGSLEGLQAEFSEIYGLICGAESTVTFSYSAAQPSFVLKRAAEMAGGETVLQQGNAPVSSDAVDIASWLACSGGEKEAAALGISADYQKILHCKAHRLGDIAPENVRSLYGNGLQLSASQIDRQAECRLSYFLKYGIRAKERKEAKVDPAEFGTYVHSVLERTVNQVMALGGFHAVDLDTTLQLADQYSEEYTREHFSQLDSQRMEYLFRRNIQELRMVVEELWRELRGSAYTPVRCELNFGHGGELPPIDIGSKTMPAKLRGVVDRVDVWQHNGQDYFRVVDYKTGKKDFDYCDIFNGVGLQMLLYLFSLAEKGEKIVGAHPVCAGVQYFPARVPYISADSPQDPRWEKERKKLWVRKGMLLQEEDSLHAMDATEGMDTLCCQAAKDGSIRGDVADRVQMGMLREYIRKILSRFIGEIESGNIQPNPYTRGTSHDACTFCPYGAVCHRAEVEQRRNYKTMTAQRFWEEVEKEVGGNG